jgi:oxygen-independent coproporphyrinogen-3 oxidase
MHLYLHVPFCARRCSYCDFAIAVRRDTPSEAYADLVLAEWRRWSGETAWRGFPALATVYFGGGTPSRLGVSALQRIMDTIGADRPLAPGAEVTLEANPEDVTVDTARAWRAAGINRVSLGGQSFEPAVLRWMHRTHTVEDIPRAVGALRQARFDNISLDLIFSLPEHLQRDWPRDLDRARALNVEHLSLYGLTVESHTPLGHWVARGEARPAPDDRYAGEFLLAHRSLTEAGFRHYEVSNYGLPGREAAHNAAYWRRAPYLGLGPSAHSASGSSRWWNLREWSAWSRAIESNQSAVAGREELDPGAVSLEDVYLGLRTDLGVAEKDVPEMVVSEWEREGWALRRSGHVQLTPEGWLRLDSLVSGLSSVRGTGTGEQGKGKASAVI